MHIYNLDSPSGLTYARYVLHTQGIRGLIIKLIHAIQLRISKIIVSVNPRPEQFKFLNHKLTYLNHPYNDTSYSERSVEIPIALDIISQYQPNQILEVGNTLNHYQEVSHKIVDKFEKGHNVINQDILDFHPKTKFDLIISISTFEHIGFDDDQLDPDKILQTFNYCRKLLKPQGKLIFTVPIGYNPFLDKLIFSHKPMFNKLTFLIRTSWSNQWKLSTRAEVRNLKYSSYYNNAQAIVVGEIHN